MKYPFDVFPVENEDHKFWVARSTCLKGCVGQGDTCDSAINELADNENAWIEAARELDIPVPNVQIEHSA